MITAGRNEFPEVERYELSEELPYRFELNRRDFIQTLGAGLLISVTLPDVFAQRRGRSSDASLQDRLHIGADGTVTVFTSKVEVGQGSRTELTMAAAEELGLPVAQVMLVMADTAAGPNDGGTAGSRTTPDTVPAVRRGCAAARELLLRTAARRFEIDPAKLHVENGKVAPLNDGQSFGYADLAKDPQALKEAPPGGVKVKPVTELTVLGKPASKVNGRAIVTGKLQYPSDIRRPGMLYAKVLRPPAHNAELLKIDPGAVKSGVVVVHDGDFVGVAAANSSEAERARDQLEKTAEWKPGSGISSSGLYPHLKSTARNGRRQVTGNPQFAEGNDHRVQSATYHIAYIQHAPMEPRAAVAEWHGEKLTVWTGTQMPGGVREELARSFKIPAENVRVIVPDTGCGFGGKHKGECAVEAARLAKAAGKPVHLRWTREEEFTWAYFRPAGVIEIRASLSPNGKLTEWEQININSGGSALETPYNIPNHASESKGADGPLRSGSYRGLASTANVFARESMMDELAALAGENPLDFRQRHISNERLRNVLTAAAEKFDWNHRWKTADKTTGFGLSCGTEKGSYAACCAKIKIVDGVYRVEEVVEAFECGAIQNPRNLKAQVEGAIMQGFGGAAREEIRFKDGKVLNAHFSRYHVPRFADVPKIEVVLLDRRDLPAAGAGETPIIGIAPAIANAIYSAVQVRIRSMPIRGENIRAA